VKEPWRTSMKGRMGNTKKGAALGFDSNPHPRFVLLETRSKSLPKGLETS